MKILQVATVATTINAFLLPFAKKFKQEGWHVDAAAEGASSHQNVVKEHDNCFDIHFCRNPFHMLRLFRSLLQIRSLLVREQYDIVHVHTPIAAFLTRIGSIGLRKTKVFYTVHGFHYINTNPVWKNMLFYLAEKLAGFRTDHLFVMNQDDYLFAHKKNIVSDKAITFTYGIGVNPEQYVFNEESQKKIRMELELSDNTFMLLQVAELNSNKNHQVVLEALSLLKQRNSDFNICYVIVGTGILKTKLEQKVQELQLNNHVVFLGQRNDVPELLAACEALSLSSKREGLPRCMLEAMCMKKPIIASSIRGCNDLLETGAGILVDFNDPEEWSKAINELFSNPKGNHKMGSIGYRLIQDKYQQNKVVDVVLNTYKKELML